MKVCIHYDLDGAIVLVPKKSEAKGGVLLCEDCFRRYASGGSQYAKTFLRHFCVGPTVTDIEERLDEVYGVEPVKGSN